MAIPLPCNILGSNVCLTVDSGNFQNSDDHPKDHENTVDVSCRCVHWPSRSLICISFGFIPTAHSIFIKEVSADKEIWKSAPFMDR